MSTTVTEITRASPRHLPGEEGVWVLIFGEMMVFSLFFIIFLYYRGQQIAVFSSSQLQLNQGFGALNTFFMLTSSWCVAMAIQSARRGMRKATPIFFSMAFLGGLGFGIVKVFEYGEKIRHGITLNTNDFFMYYYMFTGIHFMHVIIGMTILAFSVIYSRSGQMNDKKIRNLESAASFWHVVDLLWIVLFALLYLIK